MASAWIYGLKDTFKMIVFQTFFKHFHICVEKVRILARKKEKKPRAAVPAAKRCMKVLMMFTRGHVLSKYGYKTNNTLLK